MVQRVASTHLLTGGAGFIGSHLADALVARGDAVIIVDDLSTGRRENIGHLLESDRVEFIEASILNEALIEDLMESVDYCFHLASAVGVQLVVDSPLDSLLRNVRGADVVTAAAARHHRRLIYTSTSEIYGKNSNGALREDADRLLGPPSKSRWNYATAKAMGEMLAFGYAREHGSEMIIVRPFNTVGPRQVGHYGMVLPRFVSQALAGEDLTVYGDGTQSRCFTHVHDTVQAFIRLADADMALGSAFNIGSSTGLTIRELAERVIARTGSGSKIRYVPYDEAYGEGFEELGSRKANITAVQQLCGWQPERTIDEAIDHVAAHSRNVWNGVERRRDQGRNLERRGLEPSNGDWPGVERRRFSRPAEDRRSVASSDTGRTAQVPA